MIQYLILLSAGGSSKFPVVLLAPNLQTAEAMGKRIATQSGLTYCEAQQLSRINPTFNEV